MIKNIILRDVSSYSPTADSAIGPLTKVNLFYGHNGTGKTTIGNYLQAPGELFYNSCRIQPADAEREVLVYNHIFMEKNFHAGAQPGVFTLNEGNIEAENALQIAEAALKVLGEEQQAEVAAGKTLVATQGANQEELRERVWALKKPFDNSPLKYCFNLLNTKERLLEKVIAVNLATTSDTITALESEVAELQSASDAELPNIAYFTFPEGEIEKNSTFQEIITGSGDSYLSAFIQELGNSDWVKQALGFANKEDQRCPFCQQTLPEQFYDEIYKVFDKTYELKVGQLAALKKRYESGVERLQLQWRKAEYQAPAFQLHIANLETKLQKNLQSISTKVASPSLAVRLESISELIAELNAAVKIEQDKIDAINLKTKDKKKYLEQIKNRFWTCFRANCDSLITNAKKVHDELEAKKEEKRKALELIRGKAKTHREVIIESKAKITNIDQSIDNINCSLNALGLKGFAVVKEDGDLPQYRLQRPNQQDGVFKTLSEGEKTLISFLYFLEVCNGDLDHKGGKLKSNRIIVVDDPISSLSHNYIYDIASLIYRRVLSPKERFKQVFILTHNLFFFHEMLKHLKKSDDFSLFRITKADYSTVVTMKDTDVQNDYQSFWLTIKDALAGRTTASVIPNMMRNILEYYFNFVHHQDKLQQALLDLADEDTEFRALYRYVNRESHADAINITDFGEINPTHYVERFRQVFVKTGFEEHYDKMMG